MTTGNIKSCVLYKGPVGCSKFKKYDEINFIILRKIDEFKTSMKYCIQKPDVSLRTFKL
jgi:hypothetical protein